LDATQNKSNLGCNAILAVSLAVAKAASNAMNLPLFTYLGGEKACVLPLPLMNIINGGKHAGSELKIQEFQIMPVNASSYSNALRMGVEIYQELKNVLKKKYGVFATNIGDEGGYAPPMKNTSEAFEVILKAINEAGYTSGKDVLLGIDPAASSFYDNVTKEYTIDDKRLAGNELLDFYKYLVSTYPLRSIEDPFHEEDFKGFAAITKALGNNVQIIGDDIFVTNVNRLKKGIEMNVANALLMKINQIGTISEAIDAAKFALANGYSVVVSHRSGETEDSAIADIAVALNTGQIKTGAPARSERTAKYNQLLRIEEYLGERAKFLGVKALKVKL
jgi:enolase